MMRMTRNHCSSGAGYPLSARSFGEAGAWRTSAGGFVEIKLGRQL
jgi:hypothetical protein